MFGMSKHPKPGEPAAKPKGAHKGKPEAAGDDAQMVSVGVKMLASQHDKLLRLGGDAWIRERINKAREPAAE